MRRRTAALAMSLVFATLAWAGLTSPAHAIKGGVADGSAHPYVTEIVYFQPLAVDPRFEDLGAWSTCTATLVTPTLAVTAGHCAAGIGTGGVPNTSSSGGTDIWLSVSETPDLSILPPSTAYAPSDNAGRYDAWSEALDGSYDWVRATAYPHPEYAAATATAHDLGVLLLGRPRTMGRYGEIAPAGRLDQLYAANKQALYPVVGYGLEGAGPHTAAGGNTRRATSLTLVDIKGVAGAGKGVSAKFSNNNVTGGICYGDSGGPIFEPGTTRIVAVVSYVTSATCSGTSGGYRVDQRDDLAFLATFGITP